MPTKQLNEPYILDNFSSKDSKIKSNAIINGQDGYINKSLSQLSTLKAWAGDNTELIIGEFGLPQDRGVAETQLWKNFAKTILTAAEIDNIPVMYWASSHAFDNGAGGAYNLSIYDKFTTPGIWNSRGTYNELENHLTKSPKSGINYAYLEFGSTVIDPTLEDISYFAQKGIKNFRVPFNLSLLFDWSVATGFKIGGNLYLAKIELLLNLCQKCGITVMLDVHEYAKFGGDVTKNMVTGNRSQWTSFYTLFLQSKIRDAKGQTTLVMNHPALVSFNIMNEPAGVSPTIWETESQYYVDTLRDIGFTKEIVVALGDYSSLRNVYQLHAKPWIIDKKGGRITYDAHFYCDALVKNSGNEDGNNGYSGTYTNNYGGVTTGVSGATYAVNVNLPYSEYLAEAERNNIYAQISSDNNVSWNNYDVIQGGYSNTVASSTAKLHGTQGTDSFGSISLPLTVPATLTKAIIIITTEDNTGLPAVNPVQINGTPATLLSRVLTGSLKTYVYAFDNLPATPTLTVAGSPAYNVQVSYWSGLALNADILALNNINYAKRESGSYSNLAIGTQSKGSISLIVTSTQSAALQNIKTTGVYSENQLNLIGYRPNNSFVYSPEIYSEYRQNGDEDWFTAAKKWDTSCTCRQLAIEIPTLASNIVGAGSLVKKTPIQLATTGQLLDTRTFGLSQSTAIIGSYFLNNSQGTEFVNIPSGKIAKLNKVTFNVNSTTGTSPASTITIRKKTGATITDIATIAVPINTPATAGVAISGTIITAGSADVLTDNDQLFINVSGGSLVNLDFTVTASILIT
jgi:Cellulase (glycosyl hydrolase family 5)